MTNDEKDEKQEQYLYGLPIWRRSYRAASPSGKYIAEIANAREVSMSNPTFGLLKISSGIELSDCNPSFIWSDDSQYLAVPQYVSSYLIFRRQWLVVIDVQLQQCFGSPERAWYFQPESFSGGRLRVAKAPTCQAEIIEWAIPEALKRFRRFKPSQPLKPA